MDIGAFPDVVQEETENEGGSSRDQGQHQQLQTLPQEYQIDRDRPRRTNVRPPSRFSDYEMMFYALHVAEQIELAEPSYYTERL